MSCDFFDELNDHTCNFLGGTVAQARDELEKLMVGACLNNSVLSSHCARSVTECCTVVPSTAFVMDIAPISFN